jgi:hypothetical protein
MFIFEVAEVEGNWVVLDLRYRCDVVDNSCLSMADAFRGPFPSKELADTWLDGYRHGLQHAADAIPDPYKTVPFVDRDYDEDVFAPDSSEGRAIDAEVNRARFGIISGGGAAQ